MRSTLIAIAIAALLLPIPRSWAYRIKGSIDEDKPFVPYERGFVQSALDSVISSSRVLSRRRYALSTIVGETVGDTRIFSCPNMVYPFSDGGDYFCTSNIHGSCDRTSGTCICNEGYMGEACDICDTSTHFEVGGLCYRKRECPNDCSYAGRCNHLTGECECDYHRMGDDCSASKCSLYHQFCTHCDNDGCIECDEGFSVHRTKPYGAQCEPCWRFDPRCRDCNSDTCTSCVDLLLLSIHRSGRRVQDPPLPIDELSRELSVTVPFGSQQVDAFYDAEHYFLVDPSLVPLNDSAVECHQGLNNDDSITCFPYNMTSHIMCGNFGTVTFVSPEYAVREDEGHIRLTVQRTGGGVGEVFVSYSIYLMTASYDDVTATAYYTSNQTIYFRHGQIRSSFLVSINDDRKLEPNETFSIHLSHARGGVIGTQSRTIVTIIDDDELKTCSNLTSLGHSRRDLGSITVGSTFEFNVIARTCIGSIQPIAGDEFRVEARLIGSENYSNDVDTIAALGRCKYSDSGGGVYTCQITDTTVGGMYQLDVYQLIPGGLKGYYYTDNYLSDERLDCVRIDAVVNFTWGEGAVTTFGRDYISVRWEGYVVPIHSEIYTFWLEVDDHARLWIDGILLIDTWTFTSNSGMRYAHHNLVALEASEVLLEYRDIGGNASARLFWSSASTSFSVIPSGSFLYKEAIFGSPFSLHVIPSHPSAKESRASGRGLYYGIAGKTHRFTIEPRDEFGNKANNNGIARFMATAVPIDDNELGLGSSLIPVKISYNSSTSQYDSSWTPLTSGMYQLNVTLRGNQGVGMSENHIFGSPFTVTTHAGITFASESIAEGGYDNCLPWMKTPCFGMYHGVVGVVSTFLIKSFDRYRNIQTSGGDNWKVVLIPLDSAADYVSGIVWDHGNGTYSAAVTPLASGFSDLYVTLDGIPIQSSPFRMHVVHGNVSSSDSFVVMEKDVATTVALEERTLMVQVTDKHGNSAVYCDVYPFETSVVVMGVNVDSRKTQIHYIGAGLYAITVTNLNTGNMIVSIKINDQEIKNSPLHITVLPGNFSATKSSARGDGLSRATAGEEQHFFIQSKDLVGNIIIDNETQALFDVRLSLGGVEDEVTIIGTHEFVGNGLYIVNYTCFISGVYTMHVQDVDGVDISGSPFFVNVAPALMSASHSLVVGQGLLTGIAGNLAEVRVYGRDKYLNAVNLSIEIIELTMVLTSRHQSDWEVNHTGNILINQFSRDDGGGMFSLDYIPRLAGTYKMQISTYSPGGLTGSHFSASDLLPDNLVSTVVDYSIEKYYDDDPIGKLIGTQSHLGSVWTGKIAADHSEEYTIVVQCNEEGYANIVVDDLNTAWQSCYPMASINLIMTKSRAVPFALRFKSLEGSAFIKLMWRSPTVRLAKIPSRNLFYEITVGNKVFHHVTINPNTLYALKSNVIDQSLVPVAGLKQKMLVECRDMYGWEDAGNLALGGGANVDVVSIHIDSQQQVPVSVLDNSNGTYVIEFTPRNAGIYYLSVAISGSGVKGSPFLLHVKPGATEPSETILLNHNMLRFVTGEELRLVVQATDSNGNKRDMGGDDLLAAVSPSAIEDFQEKKHCVSEYTTGGLYNVTCPLISRSGSYQLDIGIAKFSNVEPIQSSPFHLTVFPGQSAPATTSIIGLKQGDEQLELISKAGMYETFSVRSHDIFNNALNVGGDHFIARVRDDSRVDSSERKIEVVDKGNGIYIFVYRLSQPAMYEIDVRMTTDSGLIGRYFANETSFKKGIPDKIVVDKQIDFSIHRMGDMTLYCHFIWTGYLSFPHSSDFFFEVTGMEGHLKLWIGDNIVLGADEDSNRGSFRSNSNIVYEVKIEYSSDNVFRLLLKLFWSSSKMERAIIPEHHLFSSSEPIRGSPFQLVVNH